MDPLGAVRKAVCGMVGESGKSESDDETLDAINEARRIIYPVGDWKDTVEPLCLDVQLGTVTLPAWAETIRKAYAGQHPLHIENQWYQRLGWDGFHRWCGSCVDLMDLGQRFATYRPYDKNFRIKVVSVDQQDKGTVLTFRAISEYGEPVSLTRVLADHWVPVISTPTSDKWVKSISYCEKPVTHDRVYVYIFDPVRGVDLQCAIYEAEDVNPQLRRYKVARGCRQIFAKVKKKYIPLVRDNELVDIHTDALMHLLQAIVARNNRDPTKYAIEVKAAANYLQAELTSEEPTQTEPVKANHYFPVTNLGF